MCLEYVLLHFARSGNGSRKCVQRRLDVSSTMIAVCATPVNSRRATLRIRTPEPYDVTPRGSLDGPLSHLCVPLTSF
jgi:hypothetical protein